MAIVTGVELGDQYIECRAYDPKVKVQNDIFPRPHEVYNCSSCKRGKELPQYPPDKERYMYWCKWDGRRHVGPRWNDIACAHWDRKVPIPKHGFMPNLESGPYDPRDRK